MSSTLLRPYYDIHWILFIFLYLNANQCLLWKAPEIRRPCRRVDPLSASHPSSSFPASPSSSESLSSSSSSPSALLLRPSQWEITSARSQVEGKPLPFDPFPWTPAGPRSGMREPGADPYLGCASRGPTPSWDEKPVPTPSWDGKPGPDPLLG